MSALVILWATASGFYNAFFTPTPHIKTWIAWFNVSLTTLFIPFFLLRIACLWLHGKPDCSLLSAHEKKIARVAHALLYINISAVLITGVLMMDRPINVFHVITLPQPITAAYLIGGFNVAHKVFCISLSMLIVAHLLAVIKHHLAGKDIIKKMLP